jgi:hypothetical protein
MFSNVPASIPAGTCVCERLAFSSQQPTGRCAVRAARDRPQSRESRTAPRDRHQDAFEIIRLHERNKRLQVHARVLCFIAQVVNPSLFIAYPGKQSAMVHHAADHARNGGEGLQHNGPAAIAPREKCVGQGAQEPCDAGGHVVRCALRDVAGVRRLCPGVIRPGRCVAGGLGQAPLAAGKARRPVVSGVFAGMLNASTGCRPAAC